MKKKEFKDFIEWFNSPAEMVRVIESRKTNSVFEKSKILASSYKGSGMPAVDLQEAKERFMYGDVETMKKVEDYQKKQAIKGGTVQKKVLRSSVCGFAPVVPHAIMGLPNAMLSFRNQPTSAKIIDIYVNCAYSYGTTEDNIIQTGLTIAKIIRNYELNGVRVNLYAGVSVYEMNKNNTQTIGLSVKLKDSGAPLNMLKVVFPLIHPAFIRRIYFRYIETTEKEILTKFEDKYGKVSLSIQHLLPKGMKYVNLSECIGLSVEQMQKKLDEQK